MPEIQPRQKEELIKNMIKNRKFQFEVEAEVSNNEELNLLYAESLDRSAKQYKLIYQSFMNVGFTEEQAMQLLEISLRQMAVQASQPQTPPPRGYA